MSAELSPFLWLLATMAVVCGARMQLARRRLALNRALHELRRPLQALALMPPNGLRRGSRLSPGSLELALIALDDLDRAVNGSKRAIDRRPVPARALVAAAVDRWRGPAARARRSITLEWRAGRAFVLADPARIAQALDNLLANAAEHGERDIRVEATACAAGLRIAVTDAGAGPRPSHRRGPRRGHGLEVVRRIARAHGGRFELGFAGGETVAVIELPTIGAPLAAVPIDSAMGPRPRPRPNLPREPASPTAA